MGLILPEFNLKPNTSTVKGSMCVPVVLDARGIYNIYIGKNIVNRYEYNSLPSFISIKIIIADELSKNPRLKSIYSVPSQRELFMCPEDGDENISWKVSNIIYVIVLHEDELRMLEGSPFDTRKKS
tara:strand:+ start:420 stop:797 length:378 start_codon:yes stop_codon:yes gene_type:complete